MKLDKFLVSSGVGTRKIVREYISQGMVKVNGSSIKELGYEIDEKKDLIEFRNESVKLGENIYYMFNKPGGCITARTDAESKTVMEYFEDVNMEGVFHVGRLDKDTEGLLLFTNDGDFNKVLMNPSSHMEKKYFFWALGNLSKEDKEKLEQGISIGEGENITRPAKIEVENQGIYEEFKDDEDISKYYSIKGNNPKQPVIAGYLTITEGRKHQVKRMLKAVGCYVIYLKRVSIGELSLDENLKFGEYRPLSKDEIEVLMKKNLKEITMK